jgi:hypothetical protein
MYGSVLVVMVDSGSFALGSVHAIEGPGWNAPGWGCGGGAHGALESKPSCNDACAMWPHRYHSTTRTDFFCQPIIQSSWWCSIDVRRCHHIIATTRHCGVHGRTPRASMSSCMHVRECGCACVLLTRSQQCKKRRCRHNRDRLHEPP